MEKVLTTEIDGLTEHEIKIKPSRETQIKLFASMKSQELVQFANTLQGMFGLGEFAVVPENRKNVTDDYYDTKDLALFHDQALLRVRRDGSNPKIVAKSLLSKSQGEFKRNEFEQATTEADLQSHIVGNFVEISSKAFPEIRGAIFSHVLKVTNERQNYLVQKPGEQYRMSLDMYFFTNPRTGRTSKQLFEIEIEALTTVASQKLGALRGNFEKALGRFAVSRNSKYEAGVKKMRIDKSTWQQRLFEAGHSGTLNWISLGVGVLGLVIGVISIV